MDLCRAAYEHKKAEPKRVKNKRFVDDWRITDFRDARKGPYGGAEEYGFPYKIHSYKWVHFKSPRWVKPGERKPVKWAWQKGGPRHFLVEDMKAMNAHVIKTR